MLGGKLAFPLLSIIVWELMICQIKVVSVPDTRVRAFKLFKHVIRVVTEILYHNAFQLRRVCPLRKVRRPVSPWNLR